MIHLVRKTDGAFADLLKHLLASGNHFDALYGEANLSYYREQCRESDSEDLSFVVVDGSVPICGLRVFSRRLKTADIEIACFGLPMLYAEQPQANQVALTNARRIVRTTVERIIKAQHHVNTTVFYKDRLLRGSLSPISRCLLDLGAEATPSISQIIDLSLPEEIIFNGLTKAYKFSVKWGKKNQVLSVIDADSITDQDVEEFRLLHAEAAGRETRSRQTWSLQHDMVREGEAFCVFAKMGGALVSAALFPHSKSHCFYGISASRRDLFDKPISHSVIWTALLHAKKLGLKYFEMGEQLFPMCPRKNPSKKELGISFFKRAFGGEPRVFLDVCLKLSNHPARVPL
jgi:hypothetical protein